MSLLTRSPICRRAGTQKPPLPKPPGKGERHCVSHPCLRFGSTGCHRFITRQAMPLLASRRCQRIGRNSIEMRYRRVHTSPLAERFKKHPRDDDSTRQGNSEVIHGGLTPNRSPDCCGGLVHPAGRRPFLPAHVEGTVCGRFNLVNSPP